MRAMSALQDCLCRCAGGCRDVFSPGSRQDNYRGSGRLDRTRCRRQKSVGGSIAPRICLHDFRVFSFFGDVFSITAAIAIALSEVSESETLMGEYAVYLRSAFVVVFSVMIANLFVVTSLGLYYLMDRLYRRDRQIISKKPEQNAA
jgi:hypothetical protein